MPTVTEEKPIDTFYREMVEAHATARGRDGAPWQKLDAMVMQARHAASRYNDTGANPNSPEDRRHKQHIRAEVERVRQECIRWRDMPQAEVQRQSGSFMMPPSAPAPTPARTARRLLNEFAQRGIRLEVGSKSRLSVRPAHLLTEGDKASLKTFQDDIAAAWLEQNQVWIVE